MKEYTKNRESQSRTVESNSNGFRQPPVSEILQAYRNGTLGRSPIQRESIEEAEDLTSGQPPVSAILQQYSEKRQRYASEEDEEMLQGKFEITQRQEKTNNTGLPDNLKSGIENLSGYSMDDVKVHYNSDKPTQLNALAYAQGTDIHVAPGQEKHLPHEAWHVVQQKQGRVQPTIQMQGVNVNDNEGLEREADNIGELAQKNINKNIKVITKTFPNLHDIIQPVWENHDFNILKWNVLIDGVRWYIESTSNLLWFEIEGKSYIKEGTFRQYSELSGIKNKKSWEEWNEISVHPLSVEDLTSISNINSVEEKLSYIQTLANEYCTTGKWYAWGKKEYMIEWTKKTEANSIKAHALDVNDSAQGKGLYLANTSWRSSTYATEDGYLLIAEFTNVPTIDINNGKQMTALNRIGLNDQDLYKQELLGDFLFIYTLSGGFARLTTNQGVILRTDIAETDVSSDKGRFGTIAKIAIEKQIQDYQ